MHTAMKKIFFLLFIFSFFSLHVIPFLFCDIFAFNIDKTVEAMAGSDRRGEKAKESGKNHKPGLKGK